MGKHTMSESEINLLFNNIDKNIEKAKDKVTSQSYDDGFANYINFINSNGVKKIGEDDNGN